MLPDFPKCIWRDEPPPQIPEGAHRHRQHRRWAREKYTQPRGSHGMARVQKGVQGHRHSGRADLRGIRRGPRSHGLGEATVGNRRHR